MENKMNVGSQNTQQNGQNPISQPVMTPEKPITNYLMIGGAVLACFVVFGFGGYYIGKNTTTPKSTVSELRATPPAQETQSNSTAPATSTLKNPIPNWETYTNQKFNFSIQYPNDFKTSEMTSQYNDTFGIEITNQRTEREYGVDADTMTIYVIVGGSDFKITGFYYGGYKWTKSIIESLSDAQNGVSKDHAYDMITKLESINVNGLTGIKYKAIPKQGTDTEGFSTLNVALIKGEQTFLISGHTGDDTLIFETPYSEIFSKVVNSFTSQ